VFAPLLNLFVPSFSSTHHRFDDSPSSLNVNLTASLFLDQMSESDGNQATSPIAEFQQLLSSEEIELLQNKFQRVVS
jgi:hypothetical protein